MVGPQAITEEPGPQNEEIEDQDEEGGEEVAEARFDEEVVHMGPVCMERGEPLGDAPAHHAETIGNRFGQKGEHHGDEADFVPAYGHLGDRGVMAENLDDESGQIGAEEQGPAVPDVNVGFAAKHVVQEKRQEGRRADKCENRPTPVLAESEDHTEEDTGHDPESAAQAVHPVNKVDGVDDAHKGEYG